MSKVTVMMLESIFSITASPLRVEVPEWNSTCIDKGEIEEKNYVIDENNNVISNNVSVKSKKDRRIV